MRITHTQYRSQLNLYAYYTGKSVLAQHYNIVHTYDGSGAKRKNMPSAAEVGNDGRLRARERVVYVYNNAAHDINNII